MRFEVRGRTIQQYDSRLGMQGDNRVETVEFVLPKEYNGVDLTQGIPFLLFELPSKETGYVVLEQELDSEKDTMVLRWLVGSQVTKETGTLKAELKLSGLGDELWHSEITTFTVARSIQADSPQAVSFAAGNSRLNTGRPSLRMVNPDTEPPITVAERKIHIPPELKNIAVQNDENSEAVTIRLPRYFDGHDLSRYGITLKTVSKGGRSDVPFLKPSVSSSEIALRWTLKPPETSFAGEMKLQLHIEGTREDGARFEWESDGSSTVNILESLDAEPVIPTTPTIMEEFLKQLLELAQTVQADAAKAEEQADRAKQEADRAASIAVKTPYIGEDGHWYVWDLEQGKYIQTDSVANGNVMFATFSIDPATGLLDMSTPEGYKGASFTIKDDYLEVIV